MKKNRKANERPEAAEVAGWQTDRLRVWGSRVWLWQRAAGLLTCSDSGVGWSAGWKMKAKVKRTRRMGRRRRCKDARTSLSTPAGRPTRADVSSCWRRLMILFQEVVDVIYWHVDHHATTTMFLLGRRTGNPQCLSLAVLQLCTTKSLPRIPIQNPSHSRAWGRHLIKQPRRAPCPKCTRCITSGLLFI